MLKNKYAFSFVIANDIVLKKTIFDPMNLKFIVDKPTVPVVVWSAVTPGSGIDGDNIGCDDCDILQCCT
jgi:hypothetical protein